MAFDKKRIFLYGSILLLILVGVYFANSIGYVERTASSSYVSASGEKNESQSRGICVTHTNGNCTATYSDLGNWTRGGNGERYNFTISIGKDSTGNGIPWLNVTGVNITTTSNLIANLTVVDSYNFSSKNTQNGSGYSINNVSTLVIVNNGKGVFFNNSLVSQAKLNITNNTIVRMSFNITAANATEGVVNWTIGVWTNNTADAIGYDSGFGVLTGVDGLPPRGNTTNVTDGTNVRTTFTSTQYLLYEPSNPTNKGINITLTVNDYNMDRVILIYNSTGGSLNFTAIRKNLYINVSESNFSASADGRANAVNGIIFQSNGSNGNGSVSIGSMTIASGNNAGGFYTNLGSRSDVKLVTAPGYVFSFYIPNSTWGKSATDGTEFKYVFVVYDLYNHSEIINNSNAEFVLARDMGNPTSTLTAPSDTTIGVYDPIKYTCNGADTSGLASCTAKLTKPTGTTISKTGCGTEQTFTTTDTNEAGTYTVTCTVVDNVGRSSETSSTFLTSTASAAGGGGGGGGGGGSAGTTAENPVTVKTGESVDAGTLSTTETYTSVAKEGTVTFMIASVSHSVKVLDVTTDTVTIEISSTPKQLTLKIGDIKEVDVDDDGKNDLSVTLKSITDGKADLVFKTLEVAPPSEEKVVEKEGVVTGEEEAKPSYTWLWIVLVVVVIALVIWYLGRKKQ